MTDEELIEELSEMGGHPCRAHLPMGERLRQASDRIKALCDMIAKHEKPLVDRKVLCAREAMKSWVGGGAGPETICVRAIELYEEGFGK
jgi:hypothetical protein